MNKKFSDRISFLPNSQFLILPICSIVLFAICQVQNLLDRPVKMLPVFLIITQPILDFRFSILDWGLGIIDFRFSIFDFRLGIGDWGLSIGDWGLGIIDFRFSIGNLGLGIRICSLLKIFGNS